MTPRAAAFCLLPGIVAHHKIEANSRVTGRSHGSGGKGDQVKEDKSWFAWKTRNSVRSMSRRPARPRAHEHSYCNCSMVRGRKRSSRPSTTSAKQGLQQPMTRSPWSASRSCLTKESCLSRRSMMRRQSMGQVNNASILWSRAINWRRSDHVWRKSRGPRVRSCRPKGKLPTPNPSLTQP